jgi:hypothetical protein
MRQSQLAKVTPQWVDSNVGDNYLFGAVRGRST